METTLYVLDGRNWDELIEVSLIKETPKMIIIEGHWKTNFNKTEIWTNIFKSLEEGTAYIRNKLISRREWILKEMRNIEMKLEKNDFLNK